MTTIKMILKAKQRAVLLFAFCLAALAACDTLESERDELSEDIQFNNSPIYLTPNSPGIIDLQSLIVSGGNARLSVSGQPKHGTLASIGTNLLRYTPNSGVKEARDGFRVSFYSSDNVIVKEDSIRIIITQDSTSFPCGVWAMNDFIEANISGAIDVDVLANDTSCVADKSLLELSLVSSPDGGSTTVPYFGTVQILANRKIRYTPGPDFEGHDKFIYRITKPRNIPQNGDAEFASFGYVYITPKPAPCGDTLSINDDTFTFELDSVKTNRRVVLNVLQNDFFCLDSAQVQIDIAVNPSQGMAAIDAATKQILYDFPASIPSNFIETLRYRVCRGTRCDTGNVSVKVK